MRRAPRVWMTLAAVAVLAAVWARPVLAQGDDEDRNPFRDDKRAALEERRRRLAKVLKVWKKVRAGEELTEAERELLERARKERERRRVQEKRVRPPLPEPGDGMMMPGVQKPGANRRLRYDERLNFIDAAYFQVAELQVGKKEYQQAVAALEKLIEKSPDPFAKSLAHLNLAELYRKELGNSDKAVAEYKKVTGELALDAQQRLAQLFEELDKVDEAVEQFESLVKGSTDLIQKALAYRNLAELLARNGRSEEAIAVLQRLIQSLDYSDAAKISKALLAERDRRDQQQQRAQQRAQTRMVNMWRQRWAGKKPQAERELRPLKVRPREPKKRGKPVPMERPILPDVKGE